MSAARKTPPPRQPVHTAADFGAHERRVLLLQGGGGRGAYQAGVYEGAAAAGFAPDWVVGISIGAINAALIAGNRPERRLERLREFWHRVSAQASFVVPAGMDFARPVINRMAAASAMRFGIPGFFAPRVPAPQYAADGTLAALSYYDTEPLHATLDELVDFDFINGGEVRLSLGAVDARSGESVYFDSTTHTITASHVMASSALPPGFPPVEIDGEYYFDGAIMSDTPVQYVARNFRIDALIVQVDLFSGMGELPRNLDQVRERVKDIRSENKARLSQDRIRQVEALRSALSELLARLPARVRADPKVKKFEQISRRSPMSLIRLVNRGDAKSSDFTDYEFSRATVDELWQAGNADIRHVLRHPEACRVTDLGNGARAFEPWPRDNKGIAA